MRKTAVRVVSTLAIACFLASSLVLDSAPIHAQDEPLVEFSISPCPDDPADPDLGESQMSLQVNDAGNGMVEFVVINDNDPLAIDSSIDTVIFHDPTELYLDPDSAELVGSEGVEFQADDTVPLGDITCPGISVDPADTFAFSAAPDDDAVHSSGTATFQKAIWGGDRLQIYLRLRDDVKTILSVEDILIAIYARILNIGFRIGGKQFTIDFSKFAKCEPSGGGTYIQLASFQLDAADDGVTVHWETATEIDNAGFNIHRASSISGPYEKINDQLVGAKGNGTGASYEFIDGEGQIGDFYRLEDIDYNGKRTKHLPIPSVAGSGIVETHSVYLPVVTIH